LAVFRPTPGKLVSASMSAGTSPSWRSTSAVAMPMMDFDFCLKKPVDTMSGSISDVSALASARAVG
jgi:hypothetical protein